MSAVPTRKNQIILPSMPEPFRRPKNMDIDDFSEDEQYYKHRNTMVRYNAWRYSLMCQKNVVYEPLEEPGSPKKDSGTKASRHGARLKLLNDDAPGRSPNTALGKHGGLGQPIDLIGDTLGGTMSPSSPKQIPGSSQGLGRNEQAPNSQATYLNRITHQASGQGQRGSSVEECPVHNHLYRRPAVGLS